jgi:hypothetical protein
VVGMARLAQPDALAIVDGLFLHRPELVGYWDFSIFLDVKFQISIPRGAARGPGYGSPDPTASMQSPAQLFAAGAVGGKRHITGKSHHLSHQCHAAAPQGWPLWKLTLTRPALTLPAGTPPAGRCSPVSVAW